MDICIVLYPHASWRYITESDLVDAAHTDMSEEFNLKVLNEKSTFSLFIYR